MTDDEKRKLIGEMLINLEMTVAEFSDLLYVLNLPFQVPTSTSAAFIKKINDQLLPQVKKLEDGIK